MLGARRLSPPPTLPPRAVLFASPIDVSPSDRRSSRPRPGARHRTSCRRPAVGPRSRCPARPQSAPARHERGRRRGCGAGAHRTRGFGPPDGGHHGGQPRGPARLRNGRGRPGAHRSVVRTGAPGRATGRSRRTSGTLGRRRTVGRSARAGAGTGGSTASVGPIPGRYAPDRRGRRLGPAGGGPLRERTAAGPVGPRRPHGGRRARRRARHAGCRSSIRSTSCWPATSACPAPS